MSAHGMETPLWDGNPILFVAGLMEHHLYAI